VNAGCELLLPESLVLPEFPLLLLTIAAFDSILPQLGRAPRAGVATVIGSESSLVRMAEPRRIRPPNVAPSSDPWISRIDGIDLPTTGR
jgi:hypothetical protein